MTLITSPSNPRISKVQDLHTPKGRKKQGLFLMEGPHLLDVLLDNAIVPLEIYYQPALLARTVQGQSLLHRLLYTSSLPVNRLIEVNERVIDRLLYTSSLPVNRLIEVNERVIEALGETQTSQGVVSVLPLRTFAPEQTRARRSAASSSTHPAARPALLILDGLADPGNMGTILRTALAADVEEVLLTPGCVDCFSPKVVRAAAGAHVALPVAVDQSWATITTRIHEHCQEEQRVLLAEAGGSRWYYEQDLRSPFALIIGNEAHGPSQQARTIAAVSISIPLANNVESLNAAMATGIILYEALRQSRSHS